jgi:hypothetical protein
MIGPVNGRAAQMQLAIEIDSDPIAGSVSVGEGQPQRFCGWIELVAAIESVRQTASNGGSENVGRSAGAGAGPS